MEEEKYIRILVKEPNKEIEIKTIPNTLEEIHKIINGNTESVCLFRDLKSEKIILVCDSDSDAKGFEKNIYIEHLHEWILGTFIIVKVDCIGRYCPITDDNIQRVKKLYKL